MTNIQKASSLTEILNKEIDGLQIEYVGEEEMTDAELNINENINIQFGADDCFYVNTWDGEELTYVGKTFQRYEVVDYVKKLINN